MGVVAKQSSNNKCCVYLSRSSVEAFAPLKAEGRGGVLDVVEGATGDGGLVGVLRGHDGQQIRDVSVQHDVHGLGRTQKFKRKCKKKCTFKVHLWSNTSSNLCFRGGNLEKSHNASLSCGGENRIQDFLL